MGKLVLFLKDATPVEIPLVKERVTIGRRPDNDVCLPYPAVSGEHAAVVDPQRHLGSVLGDEGAR